MKKGPGLLDTGLLGADVLGHAPARELEIAQDFLVRHVDLGQAALELAGEDREAAVDREIRVVDAGALRDRQRRLQRHRLRIAEVQAVPSLGDSASRQRRIELPGEPRSPIDPDPNVCPLYGRCFRAADS